MIRPEPAAAAATGGGSEQRQGRGKGCTHRAAGLSTLAIPAVLLLGLVVGVQFSPPQGRQRILLELSDDDLPEGLSSSASAPPEHARLAAQQLREAARQQRRFLADRQDQLGGVGELTLGGALAQLKHRLVPDQPQPQQQQQQLQRARPAGQQAAAASNGEVLPRAAPQFVSYQPSHWVSLEAAAPAWLKVAAASACASRRHNTTTSPR